MEDNIGDDWARAKVRIVGKITVQHKGAREFAEHEFEIEVN